MRMSTTTVTALFILALAACPSPTQAQESRDKFWLQSAPGTERAGGFLGWVGYEADRLAYNRFFADWIQPSRRNPGHGGPRVDNLEFGMEAHPEDGLGWGVLEVFLVKQGNHCYLRANNFQDRKTRELSWTSVHKDVMDDDGSVRFLAAWTPNLGSFHVSCFESPGFVRSNQFADGLVRELSWTGYFKEKIQLGLLATWDPDKGNQRVLLIPIED